MVWCRRIPGGALLVRDRPARVFVSYAHEDEPLRRELEAHLALLGRQQLIEVWHDRDIEAGDDWRAGIDSHLEQADVVLLLVSADFIASDYCWCVELKRALEKHDAGEARVIPIPLRACDWKDVPFARINPAVPADRPVAEHVSRDSAWKEVVARIREALTAAPISAARDRHRPVPPPAPAMAAKRALIVEDSDAARSSMRTILVASGMEVREATAFEEALTAIREETFDVCLLDMQLDPMDRDGQQGLVLLAQVRAWKPRVPVIIVTALPWSGKAVRDFLRQHEAYDYLTKPVQPQELRDVVLKALGDRRSHA